MFLRQTHKTDIPKTKLASSESEKKVGISELYSSPLQSSNRVYIDLSITNNKRSCFSLNQFAGGATLSNATATRTHPCPVTFTRESRAAGSRH